MPAERQIALDVIGQRQYEPHGRGKVSLEPLAWDKPGPGTVMRATMTPQEAIDRGLAPPAGCDVVIVIFWARMGTRLPDPRYREANGEPFIPVRSGNLRTRWKRYSDFGFRVVRVVPSS